MYQSKYFKPQEFACKCGCGTQEVSEVLLKELDFIRGHFGVPVRVLSGRRCDAHNRAVGGAEKSQHKEGLAADITVKGKTPKEVFEFLNSKFKSHYGIGLYKTFVHFDVRPTRARW